MAFMLDTVAVSPDSRHDTLIDTLQNICILSVSYSVSWKTAMKAVNTFITHCKNCSQPYEAQRKSSKFCSDKCRLKHSRKNENGVNKELEIIKATQALDRLLNLSDESLMEDTYLMQSLYDRAEKLRQRQLAVVAKFFGDAPREYYCNHCGQARYTAPLKDEKCAFCGQSKWSA